MDGNKNGNHEYPESLVGFPSPRAPEEIVRGNGGNV
ncbi:uncharacterized protein YbbK (DUF523 family) [Bacillus pakistanensis]|uniref:Uncharacterized protein YbbK (DUF523 family) n=1 Tax=Rossellomorea pakistanensis TaxID=992288 RepID=A0ABS2NKB6_9BACI|nr:uncharacterized protein YbbK (DUF523 family) [Bacillus pakistanensis]